MSLLNIDCCVTQRTVLPHGDVLLRGPMVTRDTGPQYPQVHQGPTRDNARGELGADSHLGQFNIMNVEAMETT